MNRNVGYIHVSTDQQENNVLSQKEMSDNYSKLNGMKVDDYFIDFGIHGKETTKGDKYLELMNLVKVGKINMMITTSLSR